MNRLKNQASAGEARCVTLSGCDRGAILCAVRAMARPCFFRDQPAGLTESPKPVDARGLNSQSEALQNRRLRLGAIRLSCLKPSLVPGGQIPPGRASGSKMSDAFLQIELTDFDRLSAGAAL